MMSDYCSIGSAAKKRSAVNQCRRFSQNAWKKDLCSNCFKSKEEHQKPDSTPQLASPHYHHLNNCKPKQSILKSVKGKPGPTSLSTSISSDVDSDFKKSIGSGGVGGGSSLKVKFPAEESQVIGFGGDVEFDSSDESNDDNDSYKDENIEEDIEDDIDLQRLTKSNTDFNSVTANLTESNGSTGDEANSPKKNVHIPLRLGHPNVDRDGQKRTLLVSVRPFGSDKTEKDAASTTEKANGINVNRINHIASKEVNENLASPIISKKNDRGKSEEKKEVDLTNINSKLNEINVTIDTVVPISAINSESKHNRNDVKSDEKIDLVNRKFMEINSSDPNLRGLGASAAKQKDAIEKNSKTTRNLDDEVVEENADENSTSVATDVSLAVSDYSSSIIENKRTTQITRGTILTKSHEQVKTKRFQSTSLPGDIKTDNPVEMEFESTASSHSIAMTNRDANCCIQTKEDADLKVALSTLSSLENSNLKSEINKIDKGGVGGSVISKLNNDGKENVKNLIGSEKNYFTTKSRLSSELNSSTYKSVSNNMSNLKLQQKNNKNRISSDDSNIKCLSFKDIKSPGFDYYSALKKHETENKQEIDKSEEKTSCSLSDEEDGRISPLTSRELAGEPDGRADSDDTNEPPPGPAPPPPALAVVLPAPRHSPPNHVLRSPPTTPPPPPPPSSAGSGGDAIYNSRVSTTNLHHALQHQQHHPPPRSSFLHSLHSTKVQQQIQSSALDKPKPPVKPNNIIPPVVCINKTQHVLQQSVKDASNVISTEAVNANVELTDVMDMNPNRLCQQQQNVMKRQAPKPPPSPVIAPLTTASSSSNDVHSSAAVIATNEAITRIGNAVNRSSIVDEGDTPPPVVKARDKRNNHNLRLSINAGAVNSTAGYSNGDILSTDFMPRSSQDLSSFNSPTVGLTSLSPSSSGPVTKRGSKVRSTLRKLLRFGSRSDDDIGDDNHAMGVTSSGSCTNVTNGSNSSLSSSSARTRPEIIHPLDLNKSGVQVLCNSTNSEQIYAISKVEESSLAASGGGIVRAVPLLVNQHQQHYGYAGTSTGRPTKPPPPPRSQSLDLACSGVGVVTRGPAPPARPPPPLNSASANFKLQSSLPLGANSTDLSSSASIVQPDVVGLSANLGDANRLERSNYIGNEVGSSGVYENMRIGVGNGMSSFSGDLSMAGLVPSCAVATTALNSHVSYCGSETESDIGCNNNNNNSSTSSSEAAVVDDDHVGTSRWRLADVNAKAGKRRQQSVVHSSLEENYGAVIIANHEALSLLLEQANRCMSTLRVHENLKKEEFAKLRWTDFTFDEKAVKTMVSIGCRRFYASQYVSGALRIPTAVTLCVNFASSDRVLGLTDDKLPNCLQVIAEFTDFIPKWFVNCGNRSEMIGSNLAQSKDMVKVTISVLPRLTIELFVRHNWPSLLSDTVSAGDKLNAMKESGLVLYQLINCFLSLQDRMIDYVNKTDIVLCKYAARTGNASDKPPASVDIASDCDVTTRLCLLPHQLDQCSQQSSNDHTSSTHGALKSSCSVDSVTLQECFIHLLGLMPLPSHLSSLINKLVAAAQQHSTSLSQVKALLELWLWGPPADVAATPPSERQHVIQRWLDLERANVLQSLLMSCPLPLQLNTYDHCHLSFLVQTNAKIIYDTLTFFTDDHSTNLNGVTEC